MEENSEEENLSGSSASGSSSSENETGRPANKRLKLEEKDVVDRISDLPDCLIQHILSFLPSTKEAIQTGILSKRWKDQWTGVPVLIFNSSGMSNKTFSQFIDKTLTLHNCSKLNKFHIQYDSSEWLGTNPHLTRKIRFAISKGVKELILDLNFLDDSMDVYTLPKSVLKNTSLVKLDLYVCSLSYRRPNWPSLKELKLECFASGFFTAIETLVSGCPLLELLELTNFVWLDEDDNVAIASKSLKRLIFVNAQSDGDSNRIEILCPNLEQLSIKVSKDGQLAVSSLPDQTIENVLSRSPLLHTLELLDCRCSDRLVITSKSLKKLVLGVIYGTSDYDISCPGLEELSLYRFLPAAFSELKCLAMKILRQVQHVKLLEIGSLFIKLVSSLELEGISSSLVNCKCLTLDGTDFDEHLQGIVRVILSSLALEKLVIKLQFDQPRKPGSFSRRKVSTILSSFQRCSPYTTIQLLCSN